MRVAALVPMYPPRSLVGAWVATHRFLVQLVERGHHVDVFTRWDQNRAVEIVDGVHVGPDNDEMTISVAVGIADVVLSHCGDNRKAARLAAKWGKPSVRMAHGHIADPEVLDGAALVVFNSRNLQQSVECPSPSIVCNPPTFAADFKTTPGDRVTLINLSEAKGGELFWRLIPHAPHRLFLGVKGHYGNQYIDRFPNAEVIEPTPNVRDDVYARTRILLMPSERETWGMTAIEASASGIPTIAHPTEGLRESLGDAGIFVDRGDPYGWLDEIERLSDPIEWRQASARSLARSAELDPQADLDRFAEAVESLVGASV